MDFEWFLIILASENWKWQPSTIAFETIFISQLLKISKIFDFNVESVMLQKHANIY